MANCVNDKCNANVERALRHGKEIGDIITYVQQTLGCSRNAAQKRVARVRATMGISANNKANVKSETPTPKAGEIQTFETNYDSKTGQTTYSGMISMKPNQNCDPEYILRQYGLDPLTWAVRSFKTSLWDAPQKKGEIIQCRSFKVSVAPKGSTEYTPEEIGKIIDNTLDKTVKNCDKRLKKLMGDAFKLTGDKDGIIVTIHLPDVHVGLLSWKQETGEDFDLIIVRRQVMNAVKRIYKKLLGMKIKEIIIITMGDLIHVDNDEQTTTKGTFQQVDGRFPKIVETAFELMFDIITLMATLAPVRYVYVPGNHDKNTGWHLAFTISKVFKDVENVTCDCSPEYAKVLIFGQAALGVAHGDVSKQQVDSIVSMLLRTHADTLVDLLWDTPNPAQHVRAQFLKLGHLHNASSHTSKDGACHIEYLDSLCAASLWEHCQGYASTPERYINAFVWDGSPVPPDRIIGSVTD